MIKKFIIHLSEFMRKSSGHHGMAMPQPSPSPPQPSPAQSSPAQSNPIHSCTTHSLGLATRLKVSDIITTSSYKFTPKIHLWWVLMSYNIR